MYKKVVVRMRLSEQSKGTLYGFGAVVVVTFLFIWLVGSLFNSLRPKDSFVILSSYENKSVASSVTKYAKGEGINVTFKYMGDLDIVDALNKNSKDYDAVWISNSMWLYMLDNQYLYSDSKSISISPVVFGIKKSKARDLDLVNKNVSNTDIVNLIKDKKIKYVMNSVTQTNTGATAYLGFLSSLAGNPEVLTEEMLENQELISNLKSVFSGVERVSGDETYLKEMFLNSDDYEAVVASESSLIEINQELKSKNKEELYFIYPTDGVAINDSTFAFIKNDASKEETFLKLQNYLLSDDGQKMLEENGQRTWYGGTTSKADKKIFNSDWGIDTSKNLTVTRFPSKKVITRALDLYIEELRKPTHVVFCLDYSGSMYGSGNEDLSSAMSYILDYDQAKNDNLQFSRKDKISVVTFGNKIKHVWSVDNGRETNELIDNIRNEYVSGGTALYTAIREGIDILSDESDDYTKTIIAMTDGAVNVGTFNSLKYYYNSKGSNIPIYSITFGDAEEAQLNEIASLSNAKVFNGKTDLLKAFKEVRSYN